MGLTESDHESFTQWAVGRRTAMLRTAVLLTGDLARAEDLVQEALTKVALRWRRLRDSNPDAYARRILVNDHVSMWRRSRLEVVETPPERSIRPGDGVVERRLMLLDALRLLTERQRAVLVLRYFEDLPEAEIAATLGVSAGTVKSTAHLALRRLRELAPELADLLPQEIR